MSKRKNLLEAFQSASEESPSPAAPKSAPQPAAAPAPSTPVEAPPVDASPVSSSETTPMTAVPSSGRRESHADAIAASLRTPFPAWLGWVGGIVVAFALGVLVGRTDEPVDAAESVTTESVEPTTVRPRGGGIVPANEGAPSPDETLATRPAQSALLDPANEYTVVVATYGGTMEDLAWATHDFLLGQGISAFSPYQVGDNIVVFAGAAPTKRELESLEQRIRALSRDGRRGVYSDAYTVEIDRYIGR